MILSVELCSVVSVKMAKKKKVKSAAKATFEIRFIGSNVSPESVPIHVVSEALSAIQDIAAGRDSFGDVNTSVPKDRGINLIDVKRGSAVYSIHAHQPEAAVKNIVGLGTCLLDLESNVESLISSINPIEKLSRVARNIGCVVKVTKYGDKKTPMLEIGEDVYSSISKKMFASGDATIIGKIVRVGGATEPRCLLRMGNRRSLLYCDVDTKNLLQELGQYLYEKVAIKGQAVWVNSNWHIHKFRITSFSKPQIGSANETISALREAGLKAWDNVDNPRAFFEEMR